MTIIFVNQKHDYLFDAITQESSRDCQLNPVILSVSIIWYVHSIPSSTNDIPICTYLDSPYNIKSIIQP